MVYNFNSYQTALTEELLEALPREVQTELLEIINDIAFIRNLVASEGARGFCKDRPHDEQGKVIVDLTNPHILEDMDYFRQPALHHEKYGAYTLLLPNSNPNSDYAKFWAEEQRRWKEGLVRPTDGEWIPGYFYFYLNYSPIWINLEEAKTEVSKAGRKKNKVKGVRKKEFPRPWLGDYLFFHYMDQAREDGGHCKLLKARGIGFSYKFGAITPCTMYTQPGLPCFHLASDKGYLLGEKGVFGKVVDTLDWIAISTPLAKLRLINKPLEKQLGYEQDGIRKGLLSSAHGISVKDDPDKARGVRGPIIQYEEDGVFPNLEETWNTNRASTEDGDVVYGTQISGGTGGTKGADFAGSEKLFYSPDAYNIYGVPNVYDKKAEYGNRCGFFWGAYLNRARCYDPSTGEPDVIKALIEILVDRFNIKNSSSDPTALTQRKAEFPITPQEAIMLKDGSIFPVADLKDYRAEVLPNINQFLLPHSVVRLAIVDGSVEAVPVNQVPIRSYPTKRGESSEGAIEIFMHPIRNHEGKTVPFRYIAGIDPIEDDSVTESVSLGSILIFDTWTDQIVAEYTGRPKTAYEFYEICKRLLMYYGATANYENTRKGLFGYFQNNHCLHLLCDLPNILKDMDMVKGVLYGNKMKGSPASEAINVWGRRLQADWLVSTAYNEDEDEDEEDKNRIIKLNMHKIRSIAYVEELIQWNPDGNFDRISAMGMTMIYREDLKRFETKSQETHIKTLADDPFFSRHGFGSSQNFDVSRFYNAAPGTYVIDRQKKSYRIGD